MVGFKFEITTIGHALVMSFIVAGFTEETVKWLFVYLFTKRSRFFDEEYDGIIYAVAVGLGFAFLENILYVGSALASGEGGLSLAIARAFTAVPSHALDGVVLGFFIGRSHFMKDPGSRLRTNLLGLLIAILFHGLYDFFAFSMFVLPQSAVGWCVVGLFWTLFVESGTAYKMIRIAQERSLGQHKIAVSLPVVASAMPSPVYGGASATSIDRRFCRFCGKPIEPGALYCPNCGSGLN
jgi:RsiW-degrading membrane proteinase PrsW (M82 family)